MQVHRSDRSGNKPFKGKSKRSTKRKNKGRIGQDQAGPRPLIGNFGRDGVGREKRANFSKQMRENKRSEYLSKRRSQVAVPRVVALVALGPYVDLGKVRGDLLEFVGAPDAQRNSKGPATVEVKIGSKKMEVTLWEAARDMVAIMDIAKVADVILFVAAPPPQSQHSRQTKHNQELGIDELGQQIISVLQSQGLPTSMGLVQHLDGQPKKTRQLLLKTYSRFFHESLNSKAKVLKAEDPSQIYRFIECEKIADIEWRNSRSYLFGEEVYFQPYPDSPSRGTLSVKGCLRGHRCLNVNRLVHITGHGDYQLSHIEEVQQIQKEKLKKSKDKDIEMKDVEVPDSELQNLQNQISARENLLQQMTEPQHSSDAEKLQSQIHQLKSQLQQAQTRDLGSPSETLHVSARADPELQESLECLLEPDPLNREQTIITDEEIKQAQEDKEKRPLKQMEDLGLSNYRDVWDELVGWGDPNDPGDAKDNSSDTTVGDSLESMKDEDLAELEKEDALKLKFKLERDELEFPDEVDTPQDTPAKERFARYRGLKNFKHSPWDTHESLPLDYARIYQFEDYEGVQKDARSEGVKGVHMGTRVIVHIKNMTIETAKEIVSQHSRMPLIVSGLMEHEHKVSVLHFLIKRVPEYEEPIKGKEPLVFHSGFRRFTGRPIYSQSNPGCDKQMVDRYLQPGRFTYASFYGRVMYPPAPTLVFRSEIAEIPQLVATGKFLTVDADRLLIKRILLTGYPIRVHKKRAVIRYMFFTPEDIRWFLPVELKTKHGFVGRVLEPLGTKGYMKCEFNNHIKGHDTVCMPLYKRQFPPLKVEEFL